MLVQAIEKQNRRTWVLRKNVVEVILEICSALDNPFALYLTLQVYW